MRKLAIMTVIPVLLVGLARAATITVGPGGGHHFNTIQDALAIASSGDEIWVAEGVYKPDQGAGNAPGDRNATFQLKNGVALYSGFPPDGGSWENRDPDAYETILSGDLSGNDGADFANYEENAYHVVNGSGTDATAVLDGFVVSGGNADSDPWEEEFVYGGGMYNYSGSPTVMNCTFVGNRALESGGGMANRAKSDPRLINCMFIKNEAAWTDGGAVTYQDNSAAVLINCTFSGNSANWGGGAISCRRDCDLTLTNCTFTGNKGEHGGAMFNRDDSNPTLINCTFSGNIGSAGGGIYNKFGGSTLKNCILWGNLYGQIVDDQGTVSSVSYSDVQGGWEGQGNIDADPCFVSADDSHLKQGSPCINAGDPNFVALLGQTDIDGEPRVMEYRVDMGADEFTGNVRPIADAGPDQTMGSVPSLVALDGSGSYDPLSDPLTYHWSQVGGPVVVLSDPNAINATFVPPEFGIYVFELVVNDGLVDSFPDTVGIVIGNNHAPIADAGPLRYAGDSPIVLDASGSFDPDGYGALTYQWRQVSGPAVVITDEDSAAPTISGFVQTSTRQLCEFELIVSDGVAGSQPDRVEVIIVPDFSGTTIVLENVSFDAGKPTVVYFSGGIGGGSLGVGSLWEQKANILSFDTPHHGSYFERHGDAIIAYLSANAPKYDEGIQIMGHSSGGKLPAAVGAYLNTTYADRRYNVNRATLLDAYHPSLSKIAAFLGSSVGDEPCWLDNYRAGPYSAYPGPEIEGALNVYLPLASHTQVQSWYLRSIDPDSLGWIGDVYNNGVVAGAYLSVIGEGKNLQLATGSAEMPIIYYFEWEAPNWHGPGFFKFFDESSSPGKLPEPVTLVGPADGDTVDLNGALLSCQESENAIGYQLLFGPGPQNMDYIIVDTDEPPSEPITAFPFGETWWTIKARDRYGTTIFADPRRIKADSFTYLVYIADNWLETRFDMQGDLNNDQILNFKDFAVFAQYWHRKQ